MITKTKIAAWLGLVIAILTAAQVFISSNSQAFGNTYNQRSDAVYINPYDYAGGLQVGSPLQASMRTLVRDNVCNALVASSTFAATTTKVFMCKDPYVIAGDMIDVRLPNTSGQFSLTGEAYATTSGFFAFGVYSYVGVSTSSYAQATTSIPYTITRTK